MKLYRFNFYLLLFSVVLVSVSCTDDEEEELMGNWSEESDFDGFPRGDAVGFAIGAYAYIGTGYDGDDRLNDFWKYDASMNYWLKMAEFPGAARNGAVAFSLNGKGYIGTGYDGDDPLQDFYEYDPESNTWKQIADFPGSARYGAVAFAVNDKGYVGSGYDGNYLKDFYAYSPETDTWEQIISIGGSKRRDAAAMVIDGLAYVVSGLDNGTYEDDVWCYDPTSGIWTEMRAISNSSDDSYDDDYSGIERINAATFTIDGKGYLVGGSNGNLLSSVWEYDPQVDTWQELTSFEGATRTEAIGFALGSAGFITTGRSSSYYFDDIWSFDPNEDYDEDN